MKITPQGLKSLYHFKSSLVKKLLGGMVVITSITSLLCYLHLEYHISFLKISNTLPGYMGAALGLLLVFRNNTAYEKWWEARKEIGGLVNVSRNIAISINGLLPPGNIEKNRIANLLIAFVFSLKEHLRKGVKMDDIKVLNDEDFKLVENSNHKPNMIVNIMMNRIEYLWKEKSISDMQQYLLIKHANTLVDILGKCERIRNTPIPMAYGFLLKFFIFLYVMILPFGLLDDLRWYAIPLVIILYYILMSIVLTAEEIEEPFGKDLNDLPMEEMANGIKRNVQEIVEME
jgi:ion channel-forming bestrophin family protein